MADDVSDPIGVVIVDDHLVFAESLSRLLGDEPDIAVLGVVTDADAVVDVVRRLQPRVVLLDYQLPGRDGVLLATDIKRAMPGVMVVMLTGTTDDQVLLGAIEAGCSGFLTKDRAAAEVGQAVRAAAVGEAVVSPALLARLLPRLHRTYRAAGADLSEREREVLNLLARGSTNKVIASELNLSVNTVRNYTQSLLGKLGVHSKLEAVSMAVREGIISYPG
ncbi:MAG: response regulator transcription factor [Actinomycetia bacterium]|nr:response regulator transcription factor [Actinomycetes bacterium]